MGDYKKLNLSGDDQKYMASLWWDPNTKKNKAGEIINHDIDLSCVLVSSENTVIDFITPISPKRQEYGVQIFHAGDNQTGWAKYEDESIAINFKKLLPEIQYIIFCVSCKKGTLMEMTINPFFHFSEAITSARIASIDLKTPPINTLRKGFSDNFITGVLRKAGAGDWEFSPIYLKLDSLDETEILKEVKEFL